MDALKAVANVILLSFPLIILTSCKKEPFIGDLFPVKKDGNWGYIDLKGNILIEPQYYKVGLFKNEIAKVESELHIEYIDKGGNVIFKVDRRLNPFDECPEFNEGFAILKTENGFKLFDREGNAEALDMNIDKAYSMSEGLIRFNIGDNYGYIRPGQKEFYINPRFQDAYDFKEDLAAVSVHDKWGFIDKNGNFVIAASMSRLNNFSEGLCLVSDMDLNDGFINKGGVLAIKPKKDYNFYSDFLSGYAIIGFTKRYNCRNEIYLRSKDMEAKGLNPLTFYKCDEDIKLGFVNKKGEIVIPLMYYGLGGFSEGLSAFAHKGKWGYIDERNKVVIPAQFDAAWKFQNGLAKVALRDSDGQLKIGYINTFGQYIWQPSK